MQYIKCGLTEIHAMKTAAFICVILSYGK